MENFKAKYTFPHDYKNSMKIVYLSSYQNYNIILCLSFCFLWIGLLLIIASSYMGYGLFLVVISLLSFLNGYRNLKAATNDFMKRQQFYPEYYSGKTAVFSNKIYIDDSFDYEIKEYRYSDIEYLIEDKALFIIKFKFNGYIHLYKNDFTIGNPSELRGFLASKHHSQKYIYARYFVSKNTLLIIIAVIISTVLLSLLNI